MLLYIMIADNCLSFPKNLNKCLIKPVNFLIKPISETWRGKGPEHFFNLKTFIGSKTEN